ncbi:MAG: triose-phosphate isomerase [Desulfarculaceae bacterium]|nr:triose-phosphate isomerase [Desulfarculaceae bacterium]MCF8072313.1 triose-phosphate isomerase [Desulfarculaceae bacterium]MCF8100234.1 triose-phosphate isomerase [Desulfarculaceae bacterium]MCF8116193.1 triose-phosphate isomerase [Desulfarculaceae bacterium]
MARRLLIAGNWKLHKTVEEAVALAGDIASGLVRDDLDVLVIPGFLALEPVALSLSASSVLVGGQNLFWEDQGAYTGEVSGPFLKAAGARYVLVGHSERREYFGETERTCRLRVEAALRSGLLPILCVGETQAEREGGQTEGVLESQLAGALAGFDAAQAANITIAYEPVWAIGTGLTASEAQANEAHSHIRAWLGARFNKDVANSTRILYGGSVKPANAAGLMNQPEVDGALVGGASLSAESFLGIIQAA